jgi:hypothetical protein
VGSQDGMVNVWDLRKMNSSGRSRGQTVAQFQSQQTPTINSSQAIRSVQFASNNSVDLLLAVEQSAYINIIDCQYYQGNEMINNEQILDIRLDNLTNLNYR